MIRIIIWKIILVCTIVSIAAKNDNTTYRNYKVFLITPETEKASRTLHNLKNIEGFVFWPFFHDTHMVLMVSPEKLSQFYKLMENVNASYLLLHNNVEEWVKMYYSYRNRSTRSTSYSFSKFHTLNEIYEQLDKLATRYPDKVQTVVGGSSYENRQIKGVKVSFEKNNPGIFIEGGIYSHQWMSPATVMYILHELLTSNHTDVRELADRHDWYIFPVFNPDGYEFTYTSAINRYWPKTRNPYNDTCTGANLNMNWDYKWNTGDTRSDPCSSEYPGKAPFSEIEAKSMSEYIKTISDKFYAYISISGYQRYILFPYGYTTESVENYYELDVIARKAKKFIKTEYERSIYVGGIAETYRTMSGCTVDYIKGVYGTRLVYMYHLDHSLGFNLPPTEIIPMGEKTLKSLVVMFKEAKRRRIEKVKMV